MEHFIKPATEEKQCSYVELVASGPQLAQWCLGSSHGTFLAIFPHFGTGGPDEK